MHHSLKLWPQYYKAVSEGKKNFEVRVNDRGFQAGDTVTLTEWDPEIREYPYHPNRPQLGPYKIGYVLPIDAERVVFSLLETQETI